MAKPFFASIAIVIILLSLENSARLMGQLDDVNEPFIVLIKFMGFLVPEYLSLGLVFALFLAVALAIRGLALSGELDIIASVGMSPLRFLRIPLLAGLACALLQFGVRSYVEPWGELQLDLLGQEIRAGELGVAIDAGEFLNPAPGITFHVSRIDRQSNRFEEVMVQAVGLTVFAKKATATNGGANGIMLNLQDGHLIREDSRGKIRAASFARMLLPLSTQPAEASKSSVRSRNARLTLPKLLARAFDETGSTDQRAARAAVASRAALALLVLALPLLAFALAIPPKRSTTAFGIGTGIILIVAYVQLSNAIEERATNLSPLYSAALVVCFVLSAAALFQVSHLKGGGFVESRLQRVFSPLTKAAARIFSR